MKQGVPPPDDANTGSSKKKPDVGFEKLFEELRLVLSDLGQEKSPPPPPLPALEPVEPPAVIPPIFPAADEAESERLGEEAFRNASSNTTTPPPSDADFWSGNVLGWPSEGGNGKPSAQKPPEPPPPIPELKKEKVEEEENGLPWLMSGPQGTETDENQEISPTRLEMPKENDFNMGSGFSDPVPDTEVVNSFRSPFQVELNELPASAPPPQQPPPPPPLPPLPPAPQRINAEPNFFPTPPVAPMDGDDLFMPVHHGAQGPSTEATPSKPTAAEGSNSFMESFGIDSVPIPQTIDKSNTGGFTPGPGAADNVVNIACMYPVSHEPQCQQFVRDLQATAGAIGKKINLQIVFMHQWAAGQIDLGAWKKAAGLAGAQHLLIIAPKSQRDLFIGSRNSGKPLLRTRLLFVEQLKLRTLLADLVVDLGKKNEEG